MAKIREEECLQSTGAGFEPYLWHLPAVWLYITHLNSVKKSFFINTIDNTYLQYLEYEQDAMNVNHLTQNQAIETWQMIIVTYSRRKTWIIV